MKILVFLSMFIFCSTMLFAENIQDTENQMRVSKKMEVFSKHQQIPIIEEWYEMPKETIEYTHKYSIGNKNVAGLL